MPPSVSESLITVHRPRFETDGEERTSLGRDVQRLMVHHDEEGLGRLEMTVLNWGRRDESSDPDFQYFDGEALDLGKEIVVRMGDDDGVEVFRGTITSIEGVFAELAPPSLQVRAEDVLFKIRLRQRSRIHESATDADIARAIASDLSVDVQADVSGPTHVQLWQVNRSDLGLLRERARAVDARVGIEDGRLAFKPRRGEDPEPIPLSRAAELLHVEVNADLAHQRTRVRVHGWSVADKEGIHEDAEAGVVDGESDGGTSGPATLEAASIEAVEDHHLEVPSTQEEARALAEALMKARARRFLVARGVTDGTPAMKVASRVNLLDVGPWYSGVYYVCDVRHVWSLQQGMRTHFIAERVGRGASS